MKNIIRSLFRTKGYKAVYAYEGGRQLYEIGKVYKIAGRPIVCRRGFHFCKTMKDTLRYYPFVPKRFKLLEVESLGKIKRKKDKLCTNKIKIIREVPMKEWDFVVFYTNGLKVNYPSNYAEYYYYDELGLDL